MEFLSAGNVGYLVYVKLLSIQRGPNETYGSCEDLDSANFTKLNANGHAVPTSETHAVWSLIYIAITDLSKYLGVMSAAIRSAGSSNTARCFGMNDS